MKRKTAYLLAAAAACAIAGAAQAQTIDGTVSPGEYGPALALQGTATGFGDNFSELDGAYGGYGVATGKINLAFTGNLEGNGNGFIIFIDAKSGGGVANTQGGGFNQFGSMGGARIDDWGTDTDGGAAVSPTPGGGSIVNAGFNPEKAIEINYYAPNNAYYTNVINMTMPNDDTHPDKDVYLGQNTPGAGAVTQTYTPSTGPAGTITHAFNNSNTAGITSDPMAPGDASTATTGFEHEFDSAFVAHEPGKAVRVLAFITNNDGGYLSNQFLPKMHYADAGNAGGAGGFEGAPLIDVRTDAFLGDMFITLFEPSFTTGADNKWSTAANWTGNFAPNGVEHDAAFNGAGGSVDLDTNVILGTLKFNGTAGYTVSTNTAKTITFNAGAGAARLDVLAYSNSLPKVIVQSDTRINTGVADVTIADLDNTAGRTITIAGVGTVNFNTQAHAPGAVMAVDSGNVAFNQDAGGVAGNRNLRLFTSGHVDMNSSQHLQELGVNAGGSVSLAKRASPPKVIYTQKLTIADDGGGNFTGKLDLNDNDLVVEYGTNASPFSTVQGYVFAGYSSSVDPTKNGIISSTGQTAGNTILALVDNALLGVSDWPIGSGNTIDANSVIGKYTYFGDMDLDGQVTPDDYGILDANLGTTPPPGIAWVSGDADLSGDVTPDDYGILDANLGSGVGNPLSPSSAASAVPEPASFAAISLAAGLLLRRRRAR